MPGQNGRPPRPGTLLCWSFATARPAPPPRAAPAPARRSASSDPATPPRHRLRGVYLPRHFAARDAAEVSAFVDAVGAADLVTFDGTKPVASLIPVLWDRSEAADGARGWGEQSAGAGKAERGRAQDGGG